MKADDFGLTNEERERLTGGRESAVEMDAKTSALAFAGLLLICAMIVAASLIAKLQAGPRPDDSLNLPPAAEVVVSELPGTSPHEISQNASPNELQPSD